MSFINESIIENYILKNSIAIKDDQNRFSEISGILKKAFDLNRPVYEQYLYPGDRVFQFVRNVSAGKPYIEIGEWFSLQGATLDGLAIHSGYMGRTLNEFRITQPICVLEGIVARMEKGKLNEIGGSGGQTQLFIYRNFFYALESMGVYL